MNGGRLIVAGRWYPSSETCSGCGAVKAKLALSERTYACAACGLVLDRASPGPSQGNARLRR
jgi:transposase